MKNKIKFYMVKQAMPFPEKVTENKFQEFAVLILMETAIGGLCPQFKLSSRLGLANEQTEDNLRLQPELLLF